MKVCFVGAGSIGKRHIRNFRRVCDNFGVRPEIHLLRSTNKVLDADIERHLSKVFYSMEDLDQQYDAVFITNPTFCHYDTLVKLNGKADTFFIEKPVFNTDKVDLSKISSREKEYYVACPLRYTNILKRAGEVICSEKISSVRAISSSYLPEWREGIDYRRTYSAHKAQGGGVKIDLIHEWDYLISFFGYPQDIYCLDGRYSDLEIDSEDIAVYIAKYEDKLVELHLDYFGRKTRRELELRNAYHEYVFDIVNNKIFLNGNVIESFVEDVNEKYLKEMQFFYRLILREEKNINDIYTAVNVLRITEGCGGRRR